MASLQDQLLKAGIVDKKQVGKVKQEKHKQVKQAKQQPRGQGAVDESKELARRALAEKAERDRQINLQRQEEAQRRALRAQIVQLVAMNRIDRGRGDVPYQFTDGRKIKKLYVTEKLHAQLVSGVIAVIGLEEDYHLVPAAVADKIRQREESLVVVHNTRSADVGADDDPYADFQIPDDLMW